MKSSSFLCLQKFLFFGVKVLKETLLRHGFEFESETDTEVIPKLAKFVYDSLQEENAGNGHGEFLWIL